MMFAVELPSRVNAGSLAILGVWFGRVTVAGSRPGNRDDGGHGPLWLGSVCQAQVVTVPRRYIAVWQSGRAGTMS